ncbi:MAG TPA: MFS transporter [Dongiaceae bacterium]|jgi:MFS family permease
MLTAIRLTAQVLLGVALFEVALGALWPLVGLQLEQQKVSTELTSIVGSAYYAGFVAGTMFCFPIIDRVGHIRAFSVFAIIATIATLLLVVLPHAVAWAFLRAIIGFALAGVFTIVESWLNDKATSETRGRIFALYTMVAWGFSGLGPLGINIEDSSGTILFCLIAIVMASAVIPVALTTVGNPDIGHRSHFGILKLYKVSPLGVLACFASGVINTGLFVLLPIYSSRQGHSTAETSILLSIASIGPLFIQYPVGWMADIFGRRPMMLATVLCAIALSTAIVNLPAGAFYWLVALVTLLASMLSPLYALGVGQTNDYLSKNDFVAASAGLLFAWGFGAIIGPVAAAPAIRFFNDPNGLFYFIGACHMLLAAFILYRMISRPALSAKQQGNYVAVDAAHASAGMELDPRGAQEPTPGQAGRVISATVD